MISLAEFTKIVFIPNYCLSNIRNKYVRLIFQSKVAMLNAMLAQKREHSISSSDEEATPKPQLSSQSPKKVVKKQKLLTSFANVSKLKKNTAVESDENSVSSTTSKPFQVILPDTNRTTDDGKCWNLKISSWNIAGIRAWIKKNGLEYIKNEDPDIITLQEVKCPESKLPHQVNLPGYHTYWVDSKKSGYAGVALYSKKKPLSVKKGLGIEEHDSEGRVITAEYDQFYLVAVYVPNSGSHLKTLPKRLKWDDDFFAHLSLLNSKKPVILCGDLNVAHEKIDLARPDTNTKTAGFTIEEREGMTNLLGKGFVDTFRHIYPEATGVYTFWAYFNNARERNTGWRIDYFVISTALLPKLCDSVVRKDILGSDHCPITLYLSI